MISKEFVLYPIIEFWVAASFSLRCIVRGLKPASTKPAATDVCYTNWFVFEKFPGSLSGRVPPDPISNSVVKTPSADDSVRSPHVKVGHRQDFNTENPYEISRKGFFLHFNW